MIVFENVGNALGAIGSNKLRSALTMLGIVIGVASVVLLVAIGQGAQRSVTSRIESLGTNLLTVSPGSPSQTNVRFGGGGGGGGSSAALTNDDVAAIREFVPGLSGVSPESSSRLQVIVGSANMNTTVTGVLSDYAAVRNSAVAFGQFVTQENVDRGDKVAVLGMQAAATLFPDGDPIGSDVRVGKTIFTIVGVLAEKGSQGFQNLDDVILVPLSTMQSRITGSRDVATIGVSVADPEQMSLKQAQITAVLLNEHGVVDASKQDFTVLNQANAVETLNEVTQVFTLLLGGIAAISLLVGGIGVMNIMLVSVTERTREIGIRKAIGAKRRDILLQFLVESTVLCLLGGCIGVAISLAASWVVTTWFGFDLAVSAAPVLLAFGFSLGIGVFFGMLPAYKAAALRPIEALRYE